MFIKTFLLLVKLNYLVFYSAEDPFSFDADPDPGSALEKNNNLDLNPNPDPGYFFKIY